MDRQVIKKKKGRQNDDKKIKLAILNMKTADHRIMQTSNKTPLFQDS